MRFRPSALHASGIIPLLLFGGVWFVASPAADPGWYAHPGVYARFKDRSYWLRYPMDAAPGISKPSWQDASARLDTMSNWYSRSRQYVEIIRQDHPATPTIGMALGFDYDETWGEPPYTPRYGRVQFKHFGWGGVEFSASDTLNFTGVSDAVSNDLSIEVVYFDGDSIAGTFSGLLLSGAGTMAMLDSGTFAVRLRRID